MSQRLGLLIGILLISACADHGGQSTPEEVVQKVFEVASSKNYEELRNLCAPEADRGIQKICDLGDAEADAQQRFSKDVAKGSFAPPQIKGDTASVDLKNEHGEADGKVFLVRKEGRWFMVSGE